MQRDFLLGDSSAESFFNSYATDCVSKQLASIESEIVLSRLEGKDKSEIVECMLLLLTGHS